MNNKNLEVAAKVIKSPGTRRKKEKRMKSSLKQNKENDRMKLLQKAADIAELNRRPEEKDFLNKVMKDTIADPKTPSQYNYESNELMHMLSKESRTQMKQQNYKIKVKKTPKSPIREHLKSMKREVRGKTINIEQCLKEIKINEKGIDRELAIPKIKIQPSQVMKFNDKVRKANAKLGRKKRTKRSEMSGLNAQYPTKSRQNSKSQPKNKERSASRNSSLAKLKNRIEKRIGKSHFTLDKSQKSDDEEKYDPKKRGIGMDFLDFLKHKPNTNNSKILSAQKTTSDWAKTSKVEKTGKKMRPSSAQDIYTPTKLKGFEDILSFNEDLDTKISPIKETQEEAITNRISDLENTKKSGRRGGNQTPSESNNSLTGKQMQPVYDGREGRNYPSIKIKPNSKSVFKSKRKSRSKNRSKKPSEERKETKNSTLESQKNYNTVGSMKERKSSMPRPFSGGNERPSDKFKPLIKQNKPRQRPNTAKNQANPELKSPKTVKRVSRKAKNVVKGPKSTKKPTKSKNLRKSSLSPSSEMGEGELHQKLNSKIPKKMWGNKRSVNDIPKVLTNQYFRYDLDVNLTLIQKYIRGYLIYRQIQTDLENEKKKSTSQNEKESSSSRNTLERMSSDNTLARATNQAELIKMMIPKVEKDINDIVHNSPKIMKNRVNSDLRRHKAEKNINSKSITSFDKTAEDKTNMKDMINKSLKLLKKRPFSAKLKGTKDENPNENDTKEKFGRIIEKLKEFKTHRNIPKEKLIPDVKEDSRKPPINSKPKRNNERMPMQPSTESLSGISQLSPGGDKNLAFSTQKYQEILK